MGFRWVAVSLCFVGSLQAQPPARQPYPQPSQPIRQPYVRPAPGPATAPQSPQRPAQNPTSASFERLIRLEVALLTEAELMHAAGYELQLQAFEKRGTQSTEITDWDINAFNILIVDKSGTYRPDQMVLSHLNQLKASSLLIFNLLSRNIGGMEMIQAMTKLNNAYYNMQSSIRFLLKWLGPDRGDLPVYRKNIAVLANEVQKSIKFLRGEENLQERNGFADQNVGPIQNAAQPEAYPIYKTPSPEERPRDGQKPVDPLLDGEVIGPDANALK